MRPLDHKLKGNIASFSSKNDVNFKVIQCLNDISGTHRLIDVQIDSNTTSFNISNVKHLKHETFTARDKMSFTILAILL